MSANESSVRFDTDDYIPPSEDDAWPSEGEHDDEMRGIPSDASDSLRQWVRDLVGKIESRPHRDNRWCELWYEHPEAVWRFEALREAYIMHAVSPKLLVSSWWVHHFDAHAPHLFGQYGIFEKCVGIPGHQPDTEREYSFKDKKATM